MSLQCHCFMSAFHSIRPEPEPVQITAYTKIRDRAVDVDPVSVYMATAYSVHISSCAVYIIYRYIYNYGSYILHIIIHIYNIYIMYNYGSYIRSVAGMTAPIPQSLLLSSLSLHQLLSLSSLTSHLHTTHRAVFALRQHAVTVRQPSLLPPLTTTTRHPSQSDMALVWKSLYMGLDSRK